MPTSITRVTADKYDDITSGEAVRLTLTYDADADGLSVGAHTTTPGFQVVVRPAKDTEGPVLIPKGDGQTADLWLVVKRAAGTADNCTVALRVGDSNPYQLPLGVRR